MPKCGSSALQSYLSSSALEQVTEGRCAYVSLQRDGRVLSGAELARSAVSSPYGYCSSLGGDLIKALTAQQQRDARAVLEELGGKHETVILSCEAWGAHPAHFADDCLFADDRFRVEVVAYVRPQVEWMNSAWWQWGAWTTLQSGQWIRRQRHSVCWHSLLSQWESKPWVEQLNVRVLDGDIVQDFMADLGYAVGPQAQINRGLPAIVLRLFQRHRQLRAGPHDSAIDFVLSRHLRLDKTHTPWVMRPGLVRELVDFFREDNERLSLRLAPDDREKMLSDRRWWEADAYAGRALRSPAVLDRVNGAELEGLAVAALEAIGRLDAELRRCRSAKEST
ncbi:hypothetical protein CKO23_14960 [Thiocystis violacea]|nr:hypothetical protein [Thiocystis violacea]